MNVTSISGIRHQRRMVIDGVVREVARGLDKKMCRAGLCIVTGEDARAYKDAWSARLSSIAVISLLLYGWRLGVLGKIPLKAD